MLSEKLPPGVVARFTTIGVNPKSLFSEEQAICKDYESGRIQEFSKGRYCAHECLKELNRPQAIGKNPDGSPIWPEGIIGSISHSQHLAGAILSNKGTHASLGLDIEQIGRITPDLWHILFGAYELKLIGDQPLELQNQFSTVLYSLKEAFYKMQYPITREGMEPKDLQVYLDNNGTVSFTPNKTVSDRLYAFNTVINYEIKEAFVISYALLKY